MSTRRFRSVILLTASVLASTATLSLAQLVAPPPPPPPPAPPPPAAAPPAAPAKPASPGRQWGVNRQDLAFAYTMLEQELRARPPEGADVAAVNRAFDALSQRFFRLDLAGAVQQIHTLIMSRRKEEPTYARRFLWSMKAEVLPAVWVNGSSRNINSAVGAIYVASRAGVPVEQLKVKFALEIEGNPGVAGTRHEFTFDGSKDPDPWRQVKLTLHNDPLPRLKPGRWRVRLVPIDPPAPPGAIDGGAIDVGFWTVVDESPIKVRGEIDDRLTKLREAAGNLPAEDPRGGIEFLLAIDTASNRASLLNEAMSPTKSAEFLLDQPAMIAELRHETSELEAGRNPYKNRSGDWWRAFTTPGGPLAARVYAPKPPADKGDPGPRPLIIALHGVGGDEAMFMEGYGAGEIKRLAEEMGFIVVSTRTEALMRDDQNFDRLVSALMQDYSIDLRRVYVVGHSMGAMAAARLAQTRGGELAAVACLAGGPRGGGTPNAEAKPWAPMLVIAAKLDTIIPATGLKAGAESAAKAGHAVEFEVTKDQGHTLMVGANLRRAVTWMLKHTAPERGK